MPQSSLLGWLNKPTGLKAAKPTPSRDKSVKVADGKDRNGMTRNTEVDEGAREAGTEDVRSIVSGSKGHGPLLPPNVELRACTKDDIAHLKRLNSLLLPIPYPESFYREIIEDPLTNSITLVAVWHDDPQAAGKEKGRLVGAIRCRIFAHPLTSTPIASPRKDGSMLYLSTLVLLSPYRRHGIAAHMLEIILRRAARAHGITSVGAHVWEANDEGLEWYRKRGFREVGREDGYYRRLKPATAMVMQRDVGVLDLLDS